jgi:hypothetical protein
LLRQGDAWVVVHLDVRAGGEVSMPKRQLVTYPDHAFLSDKLTGELLGRWLSEGNGVLGRYGFQFGDLNATVSATRRRSRERWGLVTLAQPYMEYEVAGGQPLQMTIENVGPLVSSGSPYFATWREAAAALMYDRWDFADRHQSLPQCVGDLRLALHGPWLRRVHFGSSLITVGVAGPGRAGCRLQVVGPDGPMLDVPVRGHGEDFEVPVVDYRDGRVHVVLQRDVDVLDERTIFVRGGAAEPAEDEGVTIDPPPLDEQLRALVYGGEGPTVEFKVAIGGEFSRIDRAVAAFANTAGGTVLIGVGDDRSIPGVSNDAVGALKDALLGRLRQSVRPFPPVEVEDVQIDGARVIVLFVRAGESPPYGVGKAPVYWIRRGANNYQATPEEVGALVRARMSAASNYVPAGLLRGRPTGALRG